MQGVMCGGVLTLMLALVLLYQVHKLSSRCKLCRSQKKWFHGGRGKQQSAGDAHGCVHVSMHTCVCVHASMHACVCMYVCIFISSTYLHKLIERLGGKRISPEQSTRIC